MSWAALHVHSQYSILDATASIPQLVKAAKTCGMPALALTDHGNLFGAVEFFKACKKEGVKPIIGCELVLSLGSRHEKKKKMSGSIGYPIVLLVKNQKGYQNLCQLSSLAYLEGFYYVPRIDKELLAAHSEGLICLSGALYSYLNSFILENQEKAVIEELQWFKEIFKSDFYLELTRHRMSEEQMRQDGMDREGWLYQAALDEYEKEEKIERAIKELSKTYQVPCVATNDSRYIERNDWKAHEILMNVQSGEACEIWERDSMGNPKALVANPKRKVRLSHELYFKSPEQMSTLFADFPEAIEETLKIADKCKFAFDFKSKHYPVFIPPGLEGKSFTAEERTKEAEAFLKELSQQNIAKRYDETALEKVQEKYPDKNPLDVVKERLAYELEIITSKGMCDYLLIVYDFIAWAKRQKIPMGPGRGSGAGSIICYLTGITDIEPLRFNLFFERFINPERLSYPDIDVDICMDRRSEVIEYTVRKYGQEKVAQIITFGTMKAKMAIKDVGRVLSIPLTKVNEISKLIPEDPNMTLERALEIDLELKSLYDRDEETHRLIDLAKSLEGSVRNTGIHAAGMIICADPIVEHIPVCTFKDTHFMVTQFSMKPVEEVGMLKIDFLGLKTLTAIQLAADSIKEQEKIAIDWVTLPLEDKKTFDLLNQGKTLGIFQLESAGMQDLAKQLHIDKFEEIIAVGALYRPGPMEMIPSFIQRKHGKESIEIDHPLLEDILSETYGIMVYQEQVMQMASRLANYTLGEGDVLRRAMGKKDKEEMARQREKFRLGATKNSINEQLSMHIFDKVEKFASYGFNKSHAAAYGYLSYVTAYFKANYPMHWMAALLTTDLDDLSKVTKILHECQSLKISILPPDVNESGKTFTPTLKGIRFAMGAIKGIGEAVVATIIAERTARGVFSSLFDFFKRVEVSKVGKKVVEHLIEAGCFDFTQVPRSLLLTQVEPLYQRAQKQQQEDARGIMNLFSLDAQEEEIPITENTEIPKEQILKREKELLGFYVSGHPLDNYREWMKRLSCISFEELYQLESGSVCRLACIIEEAGTKITKTGKKFAALKLGDGIAHIELPIWSELYEEHQGLLKDGQLLYLVLQVEKQQDEIKLHCRWLGDLSKIDEAMIQACDLAFDKARSQAKSMARRVKMESTKGGSPVMDTKKLHLKLTTHEIKFSHIMQLKELFQAFPGKTGICLEFLQTGYLVHIEPARGIEWNETLKLRLKDMAVIQEFYLNS